MHVSVLLDEVLGFLDQETALSLWDGTLGLAGHSLSWLEKLTGRKLYGSDTDSCMLELAEKKLIAAGYGNRISLRHGNFSDLPFEGETTFNAILLDLGVSSLHFDHFERGFSYRFDQPLDMRLDTTEGRPLHEWLASAKRDEIRLVLKKYGEESKAGRIADLIIAARKNGGITTTLQLKDICERVYSKDRNYNKHSGRHPYVKSFQAFRIFINDEINRLENSIEAVARSLTIGGRLAIISFHSLEDRIVKYKFKGLCEVPNLSPTAKSHFKPGDFKLLTKKPVIAHEKEIEANPRSRSAKLRVIERTQN